MTPDSAWVFWASREAVSSCFSFASAAFTRSEGSKRFFSDASDVMVVWDWKWAACSLTAANCSRRSERELRLPMSSVREMKLSIFETMEDM